MSDLTVFIKKIIKICSVILIADIIYLTIIYDTGALALTPSGKPSAFGKMKYVLQWPGKTVSPFKFMGEGNTAFIKNKCKYTNCFVTDNTLYRNITDFDAVVFNGRKVIDMEPFQLPKRRSPHQKYIFAATESADRFPACDEVLDNFFNWTWTYKLSSDFRFGYITTYDLDGNEVGPAIHMHWPKNMKPIGEDVKKKLSTKSKAAAIYVSDCKTISKREDLIEELDKELQKYGWNVDVYGTCGNLDCPKSEWRVCNRKIQEDYYFYLAFENSFAEDYVTEKLLLALDNYAVPIVYGLANYTRFLPPGSYLNAKKLNVADLARVMNESIKDKSKYYSFFKWRNHVTYKQTLMNDDICKLCEVLNDVEKVKTASVWTNFRRWWNGASHARECV